MANPPHQVSLPPQDNDLTAISSHSYAVIAGQGCGSRMCMLAGADGENVIA